MNGVRCLMFVGISSFYFSACTTLSQQGMDVQTAENEMQLKGVCSCLGHVNGFGSDKDFSAAMDDAMINLRNSAGKLGATHVLVLKREKHYILSNAFALAAAYSCTGDDYPPKVESCKKYLK